MYRDSLHPSLSATRIAAIEAHADDAAAMMSSTLRLAGLHGAELYGITATNGQWADKRRGLEDIIAGRRAEAQHGWYDVGVPYARQSHLAFEDGALSQPSQILKLGNYLTWFALTHRIDTFVTLGDFGGDAHPDHIASHRAALLAQHQLRTLRDEPLTVLGLSQHSGELHVPVDAGEKIRLLEHYASQFDILPLERAPRDWTRIGQYAVGNASMRELQAYATELFVAEHFTISQ